MASQGLAGVVRERSEIDPFVRYSGRGSRRIQHSEDAEDGRRTRFPRQYCNAGGTTCALLASCLRQLCRARVLRGDLSVGNRLPGIAALRPR